MRARPEPGWVRRLRRALLDFFDREQRELPWRRDRDPYRVWVSEIMLQQTRVDAVRPYYERWLARFPTVRALADAPLDDVLHAWQGLGYYARARNLHRAARLVRDQHDGTVPAHADALRALPGVGTYTAGAIASIAFGQREPAVDGNVRRVLARLFDVPEPSPAWLQDTAARLVPEQRPGDFNQAFMELGATLCTPRNPRCPDCPARDLCRALAAGTVAERPRPRTKKDVPEYDVGTAILTSPNGLVLLTRRPDHGLLAGMWTFPGATTHTHESPRRAAARAARALGFHADARSARGITRVPHTFSHRKETYHAFRFATERAHTASGDDREQPETRWLAPADLHTLALPTAQRRIAESLE